MKTFVKKKIVFQIYPDTSSSFRWRVKARNKKITAASGESFFNKQATKRAVTAFIRSMQPDFDKVNIFIQEMSDSTEKAKVVNTQTL